MDIGSSGWMKNIDEIAEQMEESLSLEGTVVAQRASELREEAQKLARQRAFLREERRRARMEEELLRQEITDFSLMRSDDWMPQGCAPHYGGKRVRLNVGGQVFEASSAVLRRDPDCLLAALCEDGGPLMVDGDGTVQVDGDWWTFRYILKFLRDGILPTDRALLTQLYREAAYWRCDTLKRAIEEDVHLYRSTFEPDSSESTHRKSTNSEAWWGRPPRRWQGKQVQVPAVEDPEKTVEITGETDWWTGSDYKGRQYSAPKATDEVASPCPKIEEPVDLATLTTWATTEINVDDGNRRYIW
ncbi:unnamed protein product [Laminaria digitata]